MSLLLVRHVDAVSRNDWPADDRLRPLTEKGFDQARALVDLLGGHRVEVILSSPAVRCVQSVEPLATALGLEVVEDPSLGEGMPLGPVRHSHGGQSDQGTAMLHRTSSARRLCMLGISAPSIV